MRRIRGELPLASEGLVQTLQHAVQRARQPGELIAAAMQPHAPAQISAAYDGLRRSRHTAHGTECASSNQESAQRRQPDH